MLRYVAEKFFFSFELRQSEIVLKFNLKVNRWGEMMWNIDVYVDT